MPDPPAETPAGPAFQAKLDGAAARLAALCAEFGIGAFEELGLGPILAQPLVVAIFKPSPDLAAPPRITALQVACFLRDYMRDKSWGIKVVKEAFFAELAASLKLSPGDLCVATSVYFPGGFLKMFGVVRKKEAAMRVELEAKLVKDLKAEVREWAEEPRAEVAAADHPEVKYPPLRHRWDPLLPPLKAETPMVSSRGKV